jgi:hypothetical protein
MSVSDNCRSSAQTEYSLVQCSPSHVGHCEVAQCLYLGRGSVRRSVSSAVYQSLVVALVLLTRLNYGKFGNAAQAGLPSYLHRRLQFVLNAAA